VISRHFFAILESLKGTIISTIIKQPTMKEYERERLGMYYRKLVNDILLGQVIDFGAATITKAQQS
jgi:hypothetical protein